MARIRICRGTASLSGDNKVTIGYGPFTGVPQVVATCLDVPAATHKQGANVAIWKKTASSAQLVAFYNGGLKMTVGQIDWIAIGPTDEIRMCCHCGAHVCNVCEVFPG